MEHAAFTATALQVYLKQPLVDLEDINTRHNVVEAFVGDPTLRETLRDQHMRGTPGLTPPMHPSMRSILRLYHKPDKHPA